MNPETADLLEKTRALALEWADESDIRFYEKTGEYHIVAQATEEKTITDAFSQLGWSLRWKKENIRQDWNRLAFRNPQIIP